MDNRGFSLLSISLGVLILSGCGGSQSLAPAVSPGNSIAAGALPNAIGFARQRGQVQYVSQGYASGLLEFDYPKSTSPIGEIAGISGGECTIGARTFWVVEGSTTLEFRVGRKKPIATLNVGGNGCSVDSKTGDLAVFSLYDVTIFKNARGSGKTISLPFARTYFGGYDAKGNIFADGFASNSHVSVAELPKGGSSFRIVTLNNTLEFPGQIQWDGTYITIEDQVTSDVYGYTCKGTTCTLERTVSLTGALDCGQTWIANGYVFCADAGNDDVEVYDYPAGGDAAATLGGNLDLPLGIVSLNAQ